MSLEQYYEGLQLHQTLDKFYVECVNTISPRHLEIDRLSGVVYVRQRRPSQQHQQQHTMDVSGLLGILQLFCGPCLCVITSRRSVGTIMGHEVYVADDMEVIPFLPTRESTMSSIEKEEDAMYIQALRDRFSAEDFYFSYTYDLTRSLQNHVLLQGVLVAPDTNYTWNASLLNPIMASSQASQPFALPVICGFIRSSTALVGPVPGRRLNIYLVSRRSARRAGTRYNVRGIDVNGDVANFVETEQIVEVVDMNHWLAFVQCRGSIPLFWSQYADLTYKPVPRLCETADHLAAFRLHSNNLAKRYGQPMIFIDLIDHKGNEGILQRRFANTCRSYNQNLTPAMVPVYYEAFDFHSECSKMRWERVALLVDRVRNNLDAIGCLSTTGTDKLVTSLQRGVVRTNCMDCLDRTNVIQSTLARTILSSQFCALFNSNAYSNIGDQPILNQSLRELWADNADILSLQYAGSPALKTDFTRTGVRSWQGIIRDFYCSLLRYYMNNFVDGLRQDCLELFLCNYNPQSNVDECVMYKNPAANKLLLRSLPWIVICCLALFILSLLNPLLSGTTQIAYIAFWLFGVIVGTRVLLFYGKYFVLQSKLMKSDNQMSSIKCI